MPIGLLQVWVLMRKPKGQRGILWDLCLESVDWFYLAYKDQWWALVNTLMNFYVL